MWKCPALAGVQSSLGLTQCFECVRKEAVYQNAVKGPLADHSSLCYPDTDAPGAGNPPSCAPLGATLGAAVLLRVPPSTSNADIPTGSGDLQGAWTNQFGTIFLGPFWLGGGSTRMLARSSPAGAPAAGRAHSHLGTRGQMWHLRSLSALQHPCQVTSDQNQLLCALWSRSWVISDGDYISVGEHLS